MALLLTDRLNRPIPDDGYPDVADYNLELNQLGNSTWFNVPWLFAECYLYRYALPVLIHLVVL